MSNIEFYSENFWRNYFKNLSEFYSCVVGLLNLKDELTQKVLDKTISELIKENLWKKVFFGGFTADESKPYHDNALAKFYEEIFGIGIKDVNLIISRLKEGSTLESATEDIKPNINPETSVMEILYKIKPKLESIYQLLKGVVDKPDAKVYEINNPTFGVEALREVLNSGKKLLPLYCPQSFFIMSLYSIPKFYAKEAYQKLFDDDAKSVLEKYDIRLTTLLEPDLPDEKMREERAVIGLSKDCVGYLLNNIILDIYKIFELKSLYKFYQIEWEFSKFVKISVEKLKQSIVIDQFLDIIQKLKSFNFEMYYYRGLIYDKSKPYKFIGSNAIVEGGDVKFEGRVYCRINYTEFFAFLAPIMFLGLAYIKPKDEKTFEWCTLSGREND